ncbi:MAG: NUDIX domain-containing protein [Pseudomonadales bacterium]
MQPLQRQNIRLAATVVLMRDTAEGVEVFMTQRPGGVDFPDLHVFPGGKVDEQDLLGDQVHGCSETEANRLLGLGAGGLRYWVTAIRECFEECGVLLARRGGTFLALDEPAEVARFDGYRQALIDRSMTMAELCERESLVLAADCLSYFSHWLTPASVPRRFDTRFFVARMPVLQQTAAHAWETAGEHWVSPGEALAAAAAGTWQMISPTLTTLRSLAGFDSAAAVFDAVARETHLPRLTDELSYQGMQPLR